jgi:DNA-binding response OmpR family regulator
MIKKRAAQEGFSCDEAADGISALKLFKRCDYNLVLLDMELPELHGANVCRQIRKVSDVPILIVSEKGGEKDKLGGFELGADDYFVSPFPLPELLPG